MTTRPNDILGERFAALRKAYAEELPRRVHAIAQAAAALEASDADALRSLFHLVHRLTGSSAVYGFPKLSRASAALEDVLLAASSGETAPVAGPALAPLVAKIRAEL